MNRKHFLFFLLYAAFWTTYLFLFTNALQSYIYINLVSYASFLARLFELSSLRRQRLRQRLGRLSFRLSFLSEAISQKLSKVSIWNLEYVFTIKRGTNYNKADDPVICISRVICPCFNIVRRKPQICRKSLTCIIT